MMFQSIDWVDWVGGLVGAIDRASYRSLYSYTVMQVVETTIHKHTYKQTKIIHIM